MPNVGFDLEVLKEVAASVSIPGDSRFAALGAIGPDLFRYAPISSKLSDALHDALKKALQNVPPNGIPNVDITPITSDATLAAELFSKPLMAAYSVLFREIVTDFWPLLQRDADLLNQLQTAANNEDEDALTNLSASTDQLTADSAQLKQLATLATGVMVLIGKFPAIPPGIQSTAPAAKPWFPFSNRLFEFLRWHHTDKFAQNLVNSADNDNKKAYANGFLSHIAGSVTGEPFINNIAGGPYRTHWWRNRLVSNFVDSWTFGRYETPASMAGDTPTPAYPLWKSITSANLQKQFNVADLDGPADKIPEAVINVGTGNLGSLPGKFPQELADYIQKVIDATYPANARPAGFSTDAIKEAFVGLFAVVWFMTSGFGPMTPLDLGAPPSTCTSPPSWVTGGGAPPSPQQSGPSTGATVCGVLLAILALILFIFQNWTGGVAAVVGAIKLFTSGGGIDWDQLKCNVFWLRKGLLDAENALVDALVKSALAYPAPAKLGTVDVNSVTHPAVDLSPNGGVPLTRTNGGGPNIAGFKFPYPRQMDAGNAGFADLNFGVFPNTPEETPGTLNFPLGPSYAETVVSTSGLQNGGLMVDGAFPSRNQFFGDAVSNAVQLISSHAKGMPRYNLDADRGYGWKTWIAQVNTFPGSGAVNNPNQEP
ncbi:MAG TPA: hypothetical protein VHD76_21745 [Bryobacteraceae bacterium]|jgi:hypothetical protein|nr:hypothetical protein [Bryobacteraceae bacterium]